MLPIVHNQYKIVNDLLKKKIICILIKSSLMFILFALSSIIYTLETVDMEPF